MKVIYVNIMLYVSFFNVKIEQLMGVVVNIIRPPKSSDYSELELNTLS